MRVLVVSAWEPGHRTEGGSLILANSLPHWAARHDVRVITASRLPGAFAEPEPASGITVQAFGRTKPAVLDYAARRVWGLAHREPAHVRWVLRPPLVEAVREAITADPPDVVHLLGWGTAPLWRLVAPAPVVHMPIDPWSVGLRNRRLPGWRALADAGTASAVRRHERVHYPRCGRIVVVAPHDAEALAGEVPAARIDVVVNGVDAGPDPPPPAAAPVLAFHGAFEAQANVDAALVLVRDVLPRVRAHVPDARALLIGRDPPPAVQALAGPDVEVTGAVPDMRAALQRASVHVDAMFTGTGLKNKVLEAMAAGLPVVATPLALSGIGAGEGTFGAAMPAELAESAVQLLKDRTRLLSAATAARSRVVRDFTWAASAAAVERIWERVRAEHAAVTGTRRAEPEPVV